MKIKDIYKKIYTADAVYSAFQDRLAETFQRVMDALGNRGFLQIIDVNMAITVDNVIPHALGVVPSGWNVIDVLEPASIWRVSWDSKTITLRASTGVGLPMTVRIEVW